MNGGKKKKFNIWEWLLILLMVILLVSLSGCSSSKKIFKGHSCEVEYIQKDAFGDITFIGCTSREDLKDLLEGTANHEDVVVGKPTVPRRL